MASSAIAYRTPEWVLGPTGRRRRRWRRPTSKPRDSWAQNATPASRAGLRLSAQVARTGPSGLSPAMGTRPALDVPGALDA